MCSEIKKWAVNALIFYEQIARRFPLENMLILSDNKRDEVIGKLCSHYGLPALSIKFKKMHEVLDAVYDGEENSITFAEGQGVTLLTVLEEVGHHYLEKMFADMGHNDRHIETITMMRGVLKELCV